LPSSPAFAAVAAGTGGAAAGINSEAGEQNVQVSFISATVGAVATIDTISAAPAGASRSPV
jgi:hypothetical protein